MRTCLFLLCFLLKKSVASWTLCPPASAHTIRDALLLSPNSLALQSGLYQIVPCPAFRPTEVQDGVLWYRVSSDLSETRLISRNTERTFPTNERYDFSSDSSLLIKGVKGSDAGTYLCRVVPRDTLFRDSTIDVQIIDETFPVSSGDEQDSASLRRGRRNQLPCDCASHSPHAAISIVYWTTGKGVSADTDIIGAKFADGSALQIKDGASYSIGSTFALEFNSLSGVHDKQRFWCHVFKWDATRTSCYTDVTITGEQPPDSTLRASELIFYLLIGKPAILPCTSWKPGDPACDVQWLKIHKSDRMNLLFHNLSTNDVRREPLFDFGSDFGLMIERAMSSQSGRYSCRVNSRETHESLGVHIIGSKFPFDDGNTTVGEAVKLKPNGKLTISCPVRMSHTATKMHIFWSFAAPDEQQPTTVIGNLVLPEGNKTISDLDRCYDISYTTGSLLLNNCSQDKDVRYWCHVFKEGDALYRSYVDVIKEDTSPLSSTEIIIVIFVPGILITIVFLVICAWRRRGNTSHRASDREGRYEMVKIKGGVPDVDRLAKAVKKFVRDNMGRVPVSPWAGQEKKDYAPIDQVYVEPEMFVRVPYAGESVKCRLESTSKLFTDDIPELSNIHVLIQGGAGSGKSVFLYKLIHDWAMGREGAILEEKRVVFYLPATVLVQAGSLGKAVIQYMFEGKTKFTPELVDAFCSKCPEEVTVLVDGCTDVEDAMNIVKDLKDCHTVIATTCRFEDPANRLRYITVTEFTREKALKFIRMIANCEGYDEADSVTDGACACACAKVGNTSRNGEKKDVFLDLCDYLEKDIIHPKVAFLPANLTLWYQMCLWTKGEIFRSEPCLGKLISKSVKCIFERSSCHSSDHSGNLADENKARNASGAFTRNQLDTLDKVGRVVWETMFEDKHNDLVEFSKPAFLTYFPEGDTAFDECLRTDILRYSKNGARDITRGATQTNECKVSCALEILQEFYAGVYIARTTENVNNDPEANAVRMARIVVFASYVNPTSSACSAIVGKLVQSFKEEFKETRGQRSKMLKISNLQKLCMFLNFESVIIDSKLRQSVIGNDVVCLVGISRYILRTLSCVLKVHSDGGKKRYSKHGEYDGIFQNIKSVRLFRLGTHDLEELRGCLDTMTSGKSSNQDLKVHRPDDNEKADLLRKILHRVKSPVVPPDQADLDVLHEIQCLGLQELSNLQYGECQSSGASDALVRNLPMLQTLEEVVLLGTVLNACEICTFAGQLALLPKLKKLDLRLNECFDDDAFVAVTNALHACKTVVDLRLSLCNVTCKGFDIVHGDMKTLRGGFWSSLKTLYLLQGSPVSVFLVFLFESLQYFHFVEYFHISTSRSTEKVPDEEAEQFLGEIKNSKIMPNLKGKPVIGNIPELAARL